MPDVSRRRLLQYLGLAPAIPLIGKIPATDVTVISTENVTTVTPLGFTGSASGGWCAPIEPFYDLPWPAEQRPVRESLPTVKARR